MGVVGFRSHKKRRPTKSTSEERGMQCAENTRKKRVGGKRSTCLVLFLTESSEIYRALVVLME